MAHACELETSLYLALQPDLVHMDRAVREIPMRTPNVHMDWADGPLSYMPHWSALTESGVTGDATLATAEKGRRWLARAQEEIAEYIAEVRARAHPAAVDHH
jgi:creatinine amidohydrolase